MSNWVNTTRTITNTEYNNLQRRAREAASLSSQVSAMADLNRSMQTALNNAERRIRQAEADARNTRTALQRANADNEAKHEAMRQELATVIRNTDARIEAANKETEERLNTMKEEFGNRLVNAIESNNRNIEAAMDRNNEIINGRIDDLRDTTNAALDDVHNQLNSIATNANDLLSVAQEYNEQTAVVQGMIEATRHAQLIPGGYKDVEAAVKQGANDIDLARKNPANASVARNNARIGFEAAVRFYEEVRNAENEWMMQLAVTEQLAETVAVQLDNSRVIEPKPGVKHDVDYWCFGDLGSHAETLDGLRERIANPDDLSTADLINIQSALRNVSSNIENDYNNAYVTIATSQSAVNDAETLRRDLSSVSTLRVVDHAYKDDDKRGDYRYILRSESTGLTVVVTVSVNRENGVQIDTAADIVDYGTMAKEDAENMVNEAVDRLVGNATGTQSRTRAQCHDRGGVVHHPERADINAWRNASSTERNQSDAAAASSH